MALKFGRLTLSTPYLPASGCYGYGAEAWELFKGLRLLWGAVTTKTITLNPRQGNAPPRIFETENGVVNRVGLQNCGLEVFIDEKFPAIKELPCPAVISIFGETPDEWAEIAGRLSGIGADALELNLSCPNLKGEVVTRDSKKCAGVVRKVREASELPLWVKINAVDSPVDLSLRLEELGVDAVVCSNSIPCAINFKGTIYEGGLTGPAIKPVVLKAVRQIRQNTSIDIAACGGISDYGDVQDYLLAGARAFVIGTALLKNPDAVNTIIEEEKSEK